MMFAGLPPNRTRLGNVAGVGGANLAYGYDQGSGPCRAMLEEAWQAARPGREDLAW